MQAKSAVVIPYPTMPKVSKDALGDKHTKYMNILSKIASDIIMPAKANTRVSAAVVYKNNIISFGINARKSHPFQAKFGKNKDAVYLHAETDAIKNALKYITIDELEKSTLYVCRIKFTDTMKKGMIFGLSKPCPGCTRCIVNFGIQSVIYSLDNTGYAML